MGAGVPGGAHAINLGRMAESQVFHISYGSIRGITGLRLSGWGETGWTARIHSRRVSGRIVPAAVYTVPLPGADFSCHSSCSDPYPTKDLAVVLSWTQYWQIGGMLPLRRRFFTCARQ